MGLSGKLQSRAGLGLPLGRAAWLLCPGGQRANTLPSLPLLAQAVPAQCPLLFLILILCLSKAILICPSHPSHCGIDQAASPTPGCTWTSVGLWLLGSASHPSLQGNVFQASYSKPPSLKYIVNSARKPKVPTRPYADQFLLFHIFF